MHKTPYFILSALTMFVATACHHKEEKEESKETLVATTPVRRDLLLYNEYVCQIHAYQHIEVRALEKGYLEKIYVDEGQFVKKGDLLFQIMPLIYQAEVQKAQAEVNYAEVEYQNAKRLADSNIISLSELALVKAKLDKAKAELNLAQAHLQFTEIRAPFDGIVGLFRVRLGSLLDEGELLTTLSDISKLWVYFNIPEKEYLDLMTAAQTKEVRSIKVKLRMANHQIYNQEGIIETIESDFNNETGNIAFRATFMNPNKILRHNETGNILFPNNLKQVLLIPQESTFEILEKKFVFVIKKEGTIQSQEIKIIAEAPHIYAVEGITEKDVILVEGINKVKNGDKIQFKHKNFDEILHELQHLHAE